MILFLGSGKSNTLALCNLPHLFPVDRALASLAPELSGIVGDLPTIRSFDCQRIFARIDFEDTRDAVMRDAFKRRAADAKMNFVAGPVIADEGRIWKLLLDQDRK